MLIFLNLNLNLISICCPFTILSFNCIYCCCIHLMSCFTYRGSPIWFIYMLMLEAGSYCHRALNGHYHGLRRPLSPCRWTAGDGRFSSSGSETRGERWSGTGPGATGKRKKRGQIRFTSLNTVLFVILKITNELQLTQFKTGLKGKEIGCTKNRCVFKERYLNK